MTAKRRERSVRDGAVSAELIESEAIRLFGEKTYPMVGMRDIGDAVGILPGSLYVHISGKEELLLQIVERGIQNYLDALTIAGESSQPASARLRHAIKAHMRVLAETLEQTKVAVHQWTYLSSTNQQQIVAMRRRYEEIFLEIVATGVDEKEFRPVRSQRIAVLGIIGMLNSATQWYSPSEALSAEEIGESLADSALIGLIN